MSNDRRRTGPCVELDDKGLADNRLAERLSKIPKVRPRKGHEFGLFVSVGDASSDGRSLRFDAPEIPTRYIKMGDHGVALLRGSTWLTSHHVDSKPRHILLDRHARIEVRDQPGAHSFGWFMTQLREHPIEAAAVWSTPPASASHLGTDIVQRLVIDPDFQEVG